MVSPKVVPPERDRRRTERIPLEPLRVHLGGTREGVLVDLSEGGALLQLSIAPPRDHQIAVEIEWKSTRVPVQARVVRSVQRRVRLESATLMRTEYLVAIEFLDMMRETSAAVRRITQSN